MATLEKYMDEIHQKTDAIMSDRSHKLKMSVNRTQPDSLFPEFKQHDLLQQQIEVTDQAATQSKEQIRSSKVSTCFLPPTYQYVNKL